MFQNSKVSRSALYTDHVQRASGRSGWTSFGQEPGELPKHAETSLHIYIYVYLFMFSYGVDMLEFVRIHSTRTGERPAFIFSFLRSRWPDK